MPELRGTIMSKKNSLKEKARRRLERETRKFHHQNTQFYVVQEAEGGYRRVYGQCETCLLVEEVRSQSSGTMNMYLQHECEKKFLTEEQVADVVESARLVVERQRNTPIEEESPEDEN